MVIGYLSCEIHLPGAHSLKEKRMRLNRVRDRLRAKHNAAFAELDFQDKWQRTRLGIVTINSQKSIVEKTLQKIIQDLEDNIDGEFISTQIEYL